MVLKIFPDASDFKFREKPALISYWLEDLKAPATSALPPLRSTVLGGTGTEIEQRAFAAFAFSATGLDLTHEYHYFYKTIS